MPDTPSPKTTLPAFTPVPRKCKRHDGWTPERQHGFIEALADYGSVRAAANSVGMTPESAYYLRRQKGADEFRTAWEAALDHGVKRIEDAAMDRALNGVEVPVYAYGKIIGTRRVYNDKLLMFMLRNRAPKRFAADGAKGMSALDKSTLARLKKEWRKQWEREQGALALEQEVATMASINAKIDALRAKEEAAERLREKHAQNAPPEADAAPDAAEALRARITSEPPPRDPDPEAHDGWQILTGPGTSDIIMQDIARYEAEEALREQEERARKEAGNGEAD